MLQNFVYLQYCAFMSITRKYNFVPSQEEIEIISNTNTEKPHLFYRNTVAKVTLYFAVKYCVLRVSERDVYTCDSPQPLPTPFHPSRSSRHQHIRLGLRMSDLWQINGFCFIKPTNRFNKYLQPQFFV